MSIKIAIRTNFMAYAEDFRRINEDWISANFWLEESDIQVLSNPQKYIFDKGSNMISYADRKPYFFTNQSA